VRALTVRGPKIPARRPASARRKVLLTAARDTPAIVAIFAREVLEGVSKYPRRYASSSSVRCRSVIAARGPRSPRNGRTPETR